MDNRPTISIAMCTYNGGLYLEEQLQSIAQQTLQPDELIICDDGSTDDTLEIAHAFAQKVTFKVAVVQNEKNLRVTINFEKALLLCSGDILFLCDQDDYWVSTKIEKTVAFFQENIGCSLVISDAELVDKHGNLFNLRLLDIVRMKPKQRKMWRNGNATEVMLHGNRVAGCVTALRRELLEQSLPFPTHIPNLIHDGWLGYVASLLERVGLIEEALTHYRQHEAQQVGALAQNNSESISLKSRFSRPRTQKLAPIISQFNRLSQIKRAAIEVVPAEAKGWKILYKKLRFLEMRIVLPTNKIKRIKPVLVALLSGNYHRFADQDAAWTGGFLAAVGDILE